MIHTQMFLSSDCYLKSLLYLSSLQLASLVRFHKIWIQLHLTSHRYHRPFWLSNKQRLVTRQRPHSIPAEESLHLGRVNLQSFTKYIETSRYNPDILVFPFLYCRKTIVFLATVISPSPSVNVVIVGNVSPEN